MAYLSIRVEGGLLSPDFLERIHEAQGQKPADFGLDSRGSIVDEVSAVWGDTRAYWDAFQRRVARAESGRRAESLTTITRDAWIIPLLEALNYSVTFQRRASEVDGRTYAISHRAGEDDTAPPVHIVAIDQELGSRPPAGRGTMSPHALLQDYLNRSDDHLWGIVTNGEILRLLRDSTYFTRPAYIEFDLKSMLEGERLDEFFLLYRLVQRSRLPRPDEMPSDCLLEHYYQDTLEQGGRIRDGLREAVSDAIITLANGFLSHPQNTELREKLKGGQLAEEELYRQLLYLIYRFLFLMVAEERNLLEVGSRDSSHSTTLRAGYSDGMTNPDYYRKYFSISRLRKLADEPLSAPQRFDDLYLGLRTLFRAFHDEILAEQLGVPPLNGELFTELADLDNAYLTNRDMLRAIRLMSYFIPKDEKVRRRINYAALDVEELGSVYESLLEEHPVINEIGGKLTFGFVTGTERRTTGSYYTPKELVTEVIKSTLLPVMEDRVEKAGIRKEAKVQALLALDVCDPACGSGHFLLAAARRIGYELAKVRAGNDEPSPRMIRDGTREAITHCIYGVDKNPMAVDLCKVALWIEGHSRGKPLTFLDYRIRCGDSLVGVFDLDVLQEGIPDDAYKAVTGDEKSVATAMRKQNKEERKGQMSLLHELGEAAAEIDSSGWGALEEMPEDTPQQVESKAKALVRLENEQERIRTACNLWTAAFFSPLTKDGIEQNLVPTTDALRRYISGQPLEGRMTSMAESLSKEHRYLHWNLAFPQVFVQGGFDVLVGNPPWERIKLQEKEWFASRSPRIAAAPRASERREMIESLKEDDSDLYATFVFDKRRSEKESMFARNSGRFPLCGRGDINTYALFAELTHSLHCRSGRAGIIVPTGIATDQTYQYFFQELMKNNSLVNLTGFENEEFIFPGIANVVRFCTITIKGEEGEHHASRFAFYLRRLGQIDDKERYFRLNNEDLALLNPNTLNCPIFRSGKDAELTKNIYGRIPVLIREGPQESNPWSAHFMRMFDTAIDSALFYPDADFEKKFAIRSDFAIKIGEAEFLPLFEAKMLWHFDHRFASYDVEGPGKGGRGLPEMPLENHQNPNYSIRPRYWVASGAVDDRLRNWSRNWLICFRQITSAKLERTVSSALVPRSATSDTSPILFPDTELSAAKILCLLANLNSLVFDYVARQKVGGTHLNYFILKQLPVLDPGSFSDSDELTIVPLSMELVYTSRDLTSIARDIWGEASNSMRKSILIQLEANRHATGGHQLYPENNNVPLPPFKWDDDRRSAIRADLDAYYARLYGLTRDELRYILDPSETFGLDFPGETFRVLKEKEIKKYGEYRTQRLVLEAWDAQQAAIETGELPWDHPDPGPSVVGPNALPAPAITVPSSPAVRTEPAKPQSRSKPTAPSKARKPATAKPAEQSRPSQAPLLQVQLPDLGIASEGTFSQRLNRVKKLSKNPSPAEIVELTVYLTAPESSIRWLASSTLSKIGGPKVEAAVKVLLEEEIGEDVKAEARKVLSGLND